MTVGRICGAHRAPLQKNSLDKNFAGTATNMPILWKINFGDTRIVIEQRAYIFHNVEAGVCDLPRAQPFQDLPALPRAKCFGECFGRAFFRDKEGFASGSYCAAARDFCWMHLREI